MTFTINDLDTIIGVAIAFFCIGGAITLYLAWAVQTWLYGPRLDDICTHTDDDERDELRRQAIEHLEQLEADARRAVADMRIVATAYDFGKNLDLEARKQRAIAHAGATR